MEKNIKEYLFVAGLIVVILAWVSIDEYYDSKAYSQFQIATSEIVSSIFEENTELKLEIDAKRIQLQHLRDQMDEMTEEYLKLANICMEIDVNQYPKGNQTTIPELEPLDKT